MAPGQSKIEDRAQNGQCRDQRKPEHLPSCPGKPPPGQIHYGPERREQRNQKYNKKYQHIKGINGHLPLPRSSCLGFGPKPFRPEFFRLTGIYKLSRATPQVGNGIMWPVRHRLSKKEEVGAKRSHFSGVLFYPHLSSNTVGAFGGWPFYFNFPEFFRDEFCKMVKTGVKGPWPIRNSATPPDQIGVSAYFLPFPPPLIIMKRLNQRQTLIHYPSTQRSYRTLSLPSVI